MGLIMLYAAVPKYFDWTSLPPSINLSEFAHMVYNYRMLPVPLVNLVAFSLPGIEALGALCLLTGVWVKPGSLMLSGFQMIFVVGMVQAMLRGLNIQCGCFVGIDETVSLLTILRDSILLVVLLLIFWGPRRQNDSPAGSTAEALAGS